MAQTVTPMASPTAIPPTATPAPTPTPVPPQPIGMVLIGEPETLHPLYATSLAAQTALAPVFVGCIGQDEKGTPVALGCQRVPSVENGDARFVGEDDDRHLEVTFKIRAGWRWTDGQPVTAQDVLYAWQLIMSPEAQLRDPLTQKVYSVAAPDQHTAVVSFMSAAQARAAAAGTLRGDVAFEYFSLQGDYARYKEQAAPLADANYWAVARWLPFHVLKDVAPRDQLSSSFASMPVGDGAFEVTAWNKGDDLVLTRSAQPFPLDAGNDAGGTSAPGLTFHFAADAASAQQLVSDGKDQISQPVPTGDASSGTGVALLPLLAFEQLVFNTTRAPFDDAMVRQAVRYALDSNAIMADPSTGLVTAPLALNPASLFHGQSLAAFAVVNDPSKARALLAESGWQCDATPCARPVTQTNGTVVTHTLEFTLVTNERVPRNALSQIIQKQLARVGFGVNIEIVHGLGQNSKLFAPYDLGGILLTRDFDAALFQSPSLTSFSGVFDCAGVPTEADHDPAQGNTSGMCDKAIDESIAQAEGGETTASEQAQPEAVAKALAVIGDATPIVALYSPLAVLPTRDVGGVRFMGFGVLTWNAWEWQQLAKP